MAFSHWNPLPLKSRGRSAVCSLPGLRPSLQGGGLQGNHAAGPGGGGLGWGERDPVASGHSNHSWGFCFISCKIKGLSSKLGVRRRARVVHERPHGARGCPV